MKFSLILRVTIVSFFITKSEPVNYHPSLLVLLANLTQNWTKDMILIHGQQDKRSLSNLDIFFQYSPSIAMTKNQSSLRTWSDTEISGRPIYLFVVQNEADLAQSFQLVNSIEGNMRQKSNNNASAKQLPTYAIIWSTPAASNLIFLLQNQSSTLVNNINLSSNLYIFSYLEENHSWHIYELYFPSSNSSLCLNEIEPFELGNKVATRSDLSGVVVRATAPKENMTQGEINWIYNKDKNESELSHGFGVDILKCFQLVLNFEIRSIPTTGWASLKPGSNDWAPGMAQEIVEGRADIGIAKTSILTYRAKSLAYLVPVHALILTAFFRQPSMSTVRNIVLLPFDTQLWLGFLFTWLLLLSSMGIIRVILKRNIRFHEEMEDFGSLWCFGAICQQGYHISPSSNQLRIIFFCGLLLGLIGYVAYAATMVSIFTTSSASIQSFEQLLRSSITITIDVDNGVARTLSTRSTLNVTYTPTSNLLIERVHKLGNSSMLKASEGQAKLLTKPFAYLTFKDKFYSTMRDTFKKDDLYLCGQVWSFDVTRVPFRSGLFVKKGSVFKEFFNAKMITLLTSGLMKRYVENYESTYNPTCGQVFTQPDGIGFNDLFSAYLILAFGAGMAISLFLLEWVISKRLSDIFTIRF